MPLRATRERGAAKRHALIDRAVIANFRRFTNHHAHAVIDEYTPPERRAGMDLDAGQETRELRDKPSEPAPARSPARMCDPVQHNGVKARITRHHCPSAAGGWIALADGSDVFAESVEHGGGSVGDRGAIPERAGQHEFGNR